MFVVARIKYRCSNSRHLKVKAPLETKAFFKPISALMVLNSAVPITQNSCLLTKIKMQLHSCFTHSQRCAFQQHSRVLYSSWHARDIKRRKLKSTGPSMPLFHLHLLGSALLYSVLFHCSWAPHQCGWDHYSNTAQKNPVMSFVCTTKQTMDDMEVMVTSAPHHWSTAFA